MYDELNTKKDEETMRVVLVRPGCMAEITDIGSSLREMQQVVGGLIEEYMPFDDEVAVILNEEGRMTNQEPNRLILSDDPRCSDLIAGTFFICYAPLDSEEFMSMPDELLTKYESMFRYPEHFMKLPDGSIFVERYNPSCEERCADNGKER